MQTLQFGLPPPTAIQNDISSFCKVHAWHWKIMKILTYLFFSRQNILKATCLSKISHGFSVWFGENLGSSILPLASKMGSMSSFQAWVGQSLMPSTSSMREPAAEMLDVWWKSKRSFDGISMELFRNSDSMVYCIYIWGFTVINVMCPLVIRHCDKKSQCLIGKPSNCNKLPYFQEQQECSVHAIFDPDGILATHFHSPIGKPQEFGRIVPSLDVSPWICSMAET